MGEAERGEAAPRHRVVFWCANAHETRVAFAADADIPELWDCPRCGLPAGQDREEPPPAPRPASDPVRRPRREHPRSEFWDVFEARWVRR